MASIKKPQPESEPKDRIMRVSKVTVWIGLTEFRIKVFEDDECNERRAATSRQGL